MVTKVNCPECDKEVLWQDDQPWKPFCSERCKLMDLGEWATGGHNIAGESVELELDIDQHNPSDYH